MNDRYPYGEDLREGLRSVSREPRRWAASLIVVALGVAAVLLSTSLASSAELAIAAQLDELAATQVELSPTTVDEVPWFGPGAERSLRRLPTVESAAHLWVVGDDAVVARPPWSGRVRLVAASEGLFDQLEIAPAGADPSAAWARGAPLVLLGAAVAEELPPLGIGEPGLWVEGRPMTLAGVIEGAEVRPDLLGAIVVPDALASAWWPGTGTDEAIEVVVQPGTADVVVELGPGYAAPVDPDGVRTFVIPTLTDLVEGISADTRGLVQITGWLLVLIGAGVVASTVLDGVRERRNLIGLARALGTRPTGVTLTVVVEATMVGVFGGALGVVLGTVAAVFAAQAVGWTPVLDPVLSVLAPVAGALVGAVAAIPAAVAATRHAPAVLLRS
ncbi:MAG: ABC transporter permease [Acidimicrobiia bacterium]